MITRDDIINAYVHLRKTNCSISDEALDFIKNSALEKLKEISEKEGLDNDVKYLNERFTQKEMKAVVGMCIGTGIGIDTVAQYVRYRNEIKKPIKTTRPLKALIKKLVDASVKGYVIQQILDIMYDNEWQTFELEWIDKKIPKKSTQNSLSEFGFNNEEQVLLK